MTKFLLLIGLALFFWCVWRIVAARGPLPPRAGRRDDAERMVQCSSCGVNQPVSESILVDGRYYCCAEHLPESHSDGA